MATTDAVVDDGMYGNQVSAFSMVAKLNVNAVNVPALLEAYPRHFRRVGKDGHIAATQVRTMGGTVFIYSSGLVLVLAAPSLQAASDTTELVAQYLTVMGAGCYALWMRPERVAVKVAVGRVDLERALAAGNRVAPPTEADREHRRAFVSYSPNRPSYLSIDGSLCPQNPVLDGYSGSVANSWANGWLELAGPCPIGRAKAAAAEFYRLVLAEQATGAWEPPPPTTPSMPIFGPKAVFLDDYGRSAAEISVLDKHNRALRRAGSKRVWAPEESKERAERD